VLIPTDDRSFALQAKGGNVNAAALEVHTLRPAWK
jgi:hypothetical protein